MKRIGVIWICMMLMFTASFFTFNLIEDAVGSDNNTFSMANTTVHNINTDEWFTQIQDAIDDSDTQDGHTIIALPNIYHENVVVDKQLNIIGSGHTTTIIDGRNVGNVMSVTVDMVTVKGFTLRGGGPINQDAGIYLDHASYCHISDNNISDNMKYSIYLYYSTDNDITGNIFQNNLNDLHVWRDSHRNVFIDNVFINDEDALYIGQSDGTVFIRNEFINNSLGIVIQNSYGNSFYENSFTHSGFYIMGMDKDTFTTQTIPINNTVNNKPVYYYKDINMNNATCPPNAGEIICAGVSWFKIDNQDLSDSCTGVTLGFSDNIIISNNSCMNTTNGVFLFSSNNCLIENCNFIMIYNQNTRITTEGIKIDGSDNVARGNTIANHDRGIFLPGSSGNLFYHNNIINNTIQVCANGGSNDWDNGYPSGGNYWSDYSGVDLYSGPNQDQPGSDGIGDTAQVYQYNTYYHVDYYPLMNTWPPAPIANAGPDQTVPLHTQVRFDGSASISYFGITNYWWNFTDGTPKTLTGASPTYVFDNESVVVVTLEIMDTMGQKDTDTMTVNVTDEGPGADAGPDQSIPQHTLVTFDGSASTDDDGITDYWWNFTDGLPKSLTGVSSTYTFNNESTIVVTLTVMDTKGQTDSDTMSVEVTDGDPPVADAGPDQSDVPGATLNFDGSNSFDPGHLGEPIDDGIVNWTWDFIDGVPVQYFGPTPNHTFNNPGTFQVTLTVTDQVGLTDTDEMNVTIYQIFDIDVSQAATSGDWILVSFPNKIEGDPLTVFQDLNGDTTWDIVQWYDPQSTPGTEWKTTATFKPPMLNTFNYVNNTYGFWVHITAFGDGMIRVVGGEPAESGEISVFYLKTGWNLVGYPFPIGQQAMYTFGTAFFIDDAMTYDSTDAYRVRFYDRFLENHNPGLGYWVHLTADENLIIQCP